MNNPRRGKVYFRDLFAGIVEQTDGAYRFTYDPNYLRTTEAAPISLTLPLRPEPYTSNTMIPFFDGLIPEGWLLDIASKSWKLNERDRMELLLNLCRDCVGVVSIIAEGSTPDVENE